MRGVEVLICWFCVILLVAGKESERNEWEEDDPANGSTSPKPNEPPKSPECNKDKINELYKEILACQTWRQPLFPSRAFGGGAGGAGAGQFGFLNSDGPSGKDISEVLKGAGGVFVSRPVPADVRPILIDGVLEPKFFVAEEPRRPHFHPHGHHHHHGYGFFGSFSPKDFPEKPKDGTPEANPKDNPFEGRRRFGPPPSFGYPGSGFGFGFGQPNDPRFEMNPPKDTPPSSSGGDSNTKTNPGEEKGVNNGYPAPSNFNPNFGFGPNVLSRNPNVPPGIGWGSSTGGLMPTTFDFNNIFGDVFGPNFTPGQRFPFPNFDENDQSPGQGPESRINPSDDDSSDPLTTTSEPDSSTDTTDVPNTTITP